MTRWLAGLFGLAALAGLAFLLLGSPSPSDLALPTAPGAVEPEPEREAPGLLGAGTGRTPSGAPLTGRFRARGRVLDAAERPVPGVPVEVRLVRPWTGNDGYFATARYYVESIRTSVTRLLAGRGEIAPIAELISDPEGRFEFRTDVEGFYALRARVAAPRLSRTAECTLVQDGFLQQPVIRVLEGAPLRGRVIDANDRPVAARIQAAQDGGDAGDWSAEAESKAGAFAFPAVPSGEIVFSVTTAAGTFQHLAIAVAPHEGDVVLRVPAGGATLTGRVQDPEGAPVADALLRLEVELPSAAAQDAKRKPTLRAGVRTSADGTYRVAGLPGGHVRGLSVAADGFRARQLYRGRAWPGVALPAATITPYDVTLYRGSTVQGQVRRHGDDRPLAGATVTLFFLGWVPPQREVATTDADGRYRFEGLGAGRFFLLPSDERHYCPHLAAALDPRGRVHTTNQPPAELALDFTDEDAALERDLVLVPGARIAGRVEGPDGRPVAQAEVFVRGFGLEHAGQAWGLGGQRAGGGGADARSGADGTFVVGNLPPRADWVLFARKRGFAGRYTDPILLTAEADVEGVIVRLDPQCVVRGRVLDEEGAPIPGISVFVGGRTELRGASHFAKTGVDGTFEADSLPATALTLSALRPGGGRAGAKLADLKPGEVREGIVLAFGAGFEISGTVVDAAGKPVPSIAIYVRRQDGKSEQRQARTDAAGAFRIQNVSAGAVTLHTLQAGGWAALGEVIEAPAKDLRLTFQPIETVTIRGTVLGPDGEPIPLCMLDAQSSDGKTARAGRRGRVTNGAFSVEIAGKPPWDVTVTSPTGRDGQRLNVRGGYARVTDPAADVVIRLVVAQTIGGRVLDEAGAPVPGAVLRAYGVQTRSGVDGSWKLVGLPEGDVPLQVEAPGDFTPPAPQVVPAGTQDVVVRLARGVAIAGRVVLPEGLPLQSGVVQGRWTGRGAAATGRVEARLSPTGTFRLTGIPPDVRVGVLVRAWHGTDGTTALAPALVEGVVPGTEDLVVRLDAGVTLSGRVVDARGAAVVKGGVNARGSVGTGFSKLDAAGRFEVKGLRPGTYRVHVSDEQGIRTRPREVKAPATDLRIEVPDLGVLSGRLDGTAGATDWFVRPVDAKTGEPLPSGVRAAVAADGTWTIERVPTVGTWVVMTLKEGVADRYAQSAPVAAGTRGIEMTLQTGGHIEGRIERGRRALPGCWVRASAPGWQSYGASDSDGRFVLHGLPPGRYALRAGSWQLGVGGGQADVPAGSTGIVVDLDEAAR